MGQTEVKTFPIQHPERFFRGVLVMAQKARHGTVLLQPSFKAGFPLPNSGKGILAGWGASECFEGNDLRAFQEFLDQHSKTFKFLHVGYDLKNQIERLQSSHQDEIGFPDLGVFIPEVLIHFLDDEVQVIQGEIDIEHIESLGNWPEEKDPQKLPIKARISRSDYLKKVDWIQSKIQAGETYELTFCQVFEAHAPELNMPKVMDSIYGLAPAPMAVFHHWEGASLASISPERFLKKEGDQLFSQPIKGTRKRGKDEMEDHALKSELLSSEKERAENIMIVDLVRNDLGRLALPGKVRVDELCGLHTFPNVHQLISTVSCTMRQGVAFTEILKATFPMGSMTGAPKVRTMNLIEEVESFRRGLFSGSVGFIDEKGNFDLNVVIRAILKNEKTGKILVPVGGAITSLADSEQEFEECLVKVNPQTASINGIFV